MLGPGAGRSNIPTSQHPDWSKTGHRREAAGFASRRPRRRVGVSLYRNVLKIEQQHDLAALGISLYDAQTTIQWSYNADQYLRTASTIKLTVLLGVFRQVERGELALDAPVHVRNRSALGDQRLAVG